MRMRTTWAAAAVFTAGTLFGVLTRLPQSTPTLLAQDNAAAVDTLPSWNDGPAKKAIIEFVAKVTKECGPDFVPVAERIAVFDNDGTLWCEQPLYFQFLFAIDRVKALAPDHPEWKDKAPFAALLKGDVKGALAGGERAILEIVMATHAGMTTEEFEKTVKDWIATARHPVSKRLYTEMVYQPMLEVLAYLRANGFKTFIVSGGGIEFMRPWVEKVYGIPPEQVVGSMGKLKYELRDGKPVFVKLPAVDFIDDKEGKPVGIQKFIGRRPIIAFGNSDGDFQMLRWTTSADDRDQPGGSQDRDQPGGSRPRLGLIVHHTDAEREYAYDRKSHIGTLDKGLDEAPKAGWVLIDMKRDWRRIFPNDSSVPARGAATGDSEQPPTMTGEWKLVKIGESETPTSVMATLKVTAEGKVSGSTGVNSYSGQLAKEKKLFGPLISTRRAGPREAMEVESALTKAMSEATRFEVRNKQLTIYAGETPRLVFERVE